MIDDRTMGLSQECDELVLCCHYLEPYLDGAEIAHRWRKNDVTIEDLYFDPESFKVYFFDLDGARAELQANIRENHLAEFEKYWITRELKGDGHCEQDQYFCKILSQYLSTPLERFGWSLERLLASLYSAKHGRPIGYNLPNLLAVANNLLEHYKEHTRLFTWALHIYGRRDEIRAADEKKKNFQKKVDRCKEGLSRKDPSFTQSSSYNELVTLLFPELVPYLP